MRAPRHQEFENIIANYFHNADVNAEEEQERLSNLFKRAKRAVDLAADHWRTVEPQLASRLVVAFTTGLAISPEATGQPPEYYRIIIPLSLIHRMSDIAERCDSSLREKPFMVSDADVVVLIAVLLAFGHEFYHAIAGHVGLNLPDGTAAPNDFQEVSSDFMGAACVARWLVADDIEALLAIGEHDTRARGFQVMFAFTLLALVFRDEAGEGYPQPTERLRTFLDGFAFGCEGFWWEVHPLIKLTQIEPHDALHKVFEGAALGERARRLWLNMPDEYDGGSRVYAPADQTTRRNWYNNAPLLRPIAKDLLQIVPRASKERK
ncbi:hypothetical protein [Rhizobium sp. C4]|uniref:hypothetical protein n=1 Tax=Rhizobium sp. C4 TaxID=1349800 RepID=UPI001E4A46D0|nr:hypothetical protein [Rhizobium sp. C4]MCD2175078.1 hypothetical protein [Rhizobium sp. C4]